MEKVKGMLGGVVGKSLKNENRYIVLTYWKDEQTHQKLCGRDFPRFI